MRQKFQYIIMLFVIFAVAIPVFSIMAKRHEENHKYETLQKLERERDRLTYSLEGMHNQYMVDKTCLKIESIGDKEPKYLNSLIRSGRIKVWLPLLSPALSKCPKVVEEGRGP